MKTESGGEHLIHQGPNFGKAADCVITPAANMSENWKPSGPTTDVSSATVGAAMEAG